MNSADEIAISGGISALADFRLEIEVTKSVSTKMPPHFRPGAVRRVERTWPTVVRKEITL
jgi:hypothetical protein